MRKDRKYFKCTINLQVLHSKLSTKIDGIKSAALYDGSITVFDCRLYGFDIGTCLEVMSFFSQTLVYFKPISTTKYKSNLHMWSCVNYSCTFSHLEIL